MLGMIFCPVELAKSLYKSEALGKTLDRNICIALLLSVSHENLVIKFTWLFYNFFFNETINLSNNNSSTKKIGENS